MIQIWERIGTGFTLLAGLASVGGISACLSASLLALMAAHLAPPRPEPSGVPRKQWEIDGGA